MQIRIAKLDDLDAIVAIYNQAILAGQCTADTQPFKIEDRIDWFNAHSPEKYPLLVAVEGQTIMGYLTISPYREGRKAFLRTAEISYYIHFQHHRKGVGSQLMDHALELCPSLNIKRLIAMLLASNNGSIAFLEKYNFKKWGRMPAIAEFDHKTVDHLYYGVHL